MDVLRIADPGDRGQRGHVYKFTATEIYFQMEFLGLSLNDADIQGRIENSPPRVTIISSFSTKTGDFKENLVQWRGFHGEFLHANSPLITTSL